MPALLLDLSRGELGEKSEWLGLPEGEWGVLVGAAVQCAGWWAAMAGAGMLFWWMLTRVTGARWSDPLTAVWRHNALLFLVGGYALVTLSAASRAEALGESFPLFTSPSAALTAGGAVLALLMFAAHRSGKEKYLRFVSAVGLIALLPLMAAMAVAGAGGWSTSMAPLNDMAGGAVAALALGLLAPEARDAAVRRAALLLMAVALAFGLYLSFSRFLIVSYGQIPAEMSFFQVRSEGEWGSFFPALALLGLILPVVAALLATVYRKTWAARCLAWLVLATTVVEWCWRSLPPVSSSAFAGIGLVALSLAPLGVLADNFHRERVRRPLSAK